MLVKIRINILKKCNESVLTISFLTDIAGNKSLSLEKFLWSTISLIMDKNSIGFTIVENFKNSIDLSRKHKQRKLRWSWLIRFISKTCHDVLSSFYFDRSKFK